MPDEQPQEEKQDLVKALEARVEDEKTLNNFISSGIGSIKEYITGDELPDYERICVLMREVLGYMIEHCHRLMLRSQSRHVRTLILAPRGIGKSTALITGRVLYELIRNPNIRILISSNTQSQAEVFLRGIKNHIEANDEFIEMFGNLKGDKWANAEINIKTRTIFSNETNVTCLGVGGAVVGRHYDLILFDDLVDEENSRTELQREKLRIWFFKVLEPTLEPDGRLWGHGTRYYPNDLYEHLINQSSVKDDQGNRVPMENLTELHYKYQRFPAIKKNGESIWPDKMSMEWLEAKRATAGKAIFDSQYQNTTDAMQGAIFQFEHIRYYKIPPDNLRIFQGVDLAISKKESADYFSIVTIGKDEYNRIYLLDVYFDRLSFLQQFNTIVSKFIQFDPMRVFVEANAYQMAQVHLLSALSEVRVKPVITLKDKVTRAWHLASKFENHLVYFPEFGVHNFTDMLIAFPDCDHDDPFDAFELAVTGSGMRMKKDRKQFGLI